MKREIRTERLLLRPFAASDEAAVSAFAGREDYRRYLGSGHPDAAALVANNVTVDFDREPGWVIEFERRVVGSVFLGIRPPEAELAAMISPDHWRRGIASEACVAVVREAFAQPGIERVIAHAHAGNLASRSAMEKSGMRLAEVQAGARQEESGEAGDQVLYVLERADLPQL